MYNWCIFNRFCLWGGLSALNGHWRICYCKKPLILDLKIFWKYNTCKTFIWQIHYMHTHTYKKTVFKRVFSKIQMGSHYQPQKWDFGVKTDISAKIYFSGSLHIFAIEVMDEKANYVQCFRKSWIFKILHLSLASTELLLVVPKMVNQQESPLTEIYCEV